MAGMEGPRAAQPEDDDAGPYGVFGEGRPRKIVGESDEPPRRRPRRQPGTKPSGPQEPAD
jgi:hypothetical protein